MKKILSLILPLHVWEAKKRFFIRQFIHGMMPSECLAGWLLQCLICINDNSWILDTNNPSPLLSEWLLSFSPARSHCQAGVFFAVSGCTLSQTFLFVPNSLFRTPNTWKEAWWASISPPWGGGGRRTPPRFGRALMGILKCVSLFAQRALLN